MANHTQNPWFETAPSFLPACIGPTCGAWLAQHLWTHYQFTLDREFLRAKGVKIVYEGRRGPGCNPGVEFLDPDGFNIELYACMDQIGWDQKSRPADQWRRASSLEEAVENPVIGVKY